MPDHLGDDMRKVRPEDKEEEIKCMYIYCADCGRHGTHNTNGLKILSGNVVKYIRFCFITALDEGDIELLKTYVSDCQFIRFYF